MKTFEPIASETIEPMGPTLGAHPASRAPVPLAETRFALTEAKYTCAPSSFMFSLPVTTGAHKGSAVPAPVVDIFAAPLRNWPPMLVNEPET